MHRVCYQHVMEQYPAYRLQPYASSAAAAAAAAALHRYSVTFEPQLVHFQQHLQYLRYTEPVELTAYPLDLSVRAQPPITPPCTPSPGHKRAPSASGGDVDPTAVAAAGPADLANNNHYQSDPVPTPTPTKKARTPAPPTPKRAKAVRKLNFDEDKSSPVSGTIIRELGPDETLVVRKGDIDPAFNVVEVTEEAKAELAKIDNLIGDYVCRLCRELYEDAFGLAQHRCSRIVHVEYRCPECDKVFNCPANLASHRRWHKPRAAKETRMSDASDATDDSGTTADQYPCTECGKRFRRLAYLRKHQATHASPPSDGAPTE